MSVAPILPVAALESTPLSSPASHATAPVSFSQLLTGGIAQVQDKVATADRTVKAFVLDDAIPVHQVSYALEQARLSLELALQVRNRVVEGYQQLMNMQM